MRPLTFLYRDESHQYKVSPCPESEICRCSCSTTVYFPEFETVDVDIKVLKGADLVDVSALIPVRDLGTRGKDNGIAGSSSDHDIH
jgi:hypothetical protein